MKKAFKAVSITICMIFLFFAFAACDNDLNPPIGTPAPTQSTDTGEITYSGGDLADGYYGMYYSESVATAAGAKNITYALKEGSVLHTGLYLSSKGKITGTPTELGEKSFIVIASAQGSDDVEAEFTINVISPILSYEGGNLSIGFVQTLYTDSVATATGSKNISYSLKAGDELPEGLTLSADGEISGTVTDAGEYSFTVIASAQGFEYVEAEFTIVINELGIMQYSGKALSGAFIGKVYSDTVATITGIDNIEYTLKSGSVLPQNLTLSSDGTITGTPQSEGDYSFTIVAKCYGFENAEAQFVISISVLQEIDFEGFELDEGEIDSAYNKSIAIETLTGITYALKQGSSLPDGLSLSADGIISGIPTEECTVTFTVIASGYGNTAEAEFTLRINPVSLKEFVFEAEHVDFTGLLGVGWSCSVEEWHLIVGYGPDSDTTASNGYYVAYYTVPGTELKFNFKADRAGKGQLSFGMVSEYGPFIMESSIMELWVNGQQVLYENILKQDLVINGVNEPTSNFDNYVFLDELEFVEGENYVSIIIRENDLFTGRDAGGPNVDYMKIITEANLVFDTPFSNEDIIERRGY